MDITRFPNAETIKIYVLRLSLCPDHKGHNIIQDVIELDDYVWDEERQAYMENTPFLSTDYKKDTIHFKKLYNYTASMAYEEMPSKETIALIVPKLKNTIEIVLEGEKEHYIRRYDSLLEKINN